MSDHIVVKEDKVINIDFLESDSDCEDDNYDLPSEGEIESDDEETEELGDFLQSLLVEIGEVSNIGVRKFRLELFCPKGIDFLKKGESVDFDLNKEGFPFLPQGGEEFILPFFKKLTELKPDLKGVVIKNNFGKDIKL